LDAPNRAGVTLREQYEQVEKSTGRMPDGFFGPDCPEGLDLAWEAFLDLSATRPVGFSGPSAIPYAEIAAWCSLTGNDLSPTEVELIKAADRHYLIRRAEAERAAAADGGN